jgi:hypothetical protein
MYGEGSVMNTIERKATIYASVMTGMFVTQLSLFNSYFYTFHQAQVLMFVTTIIALVAGIIGFYYLIKCFK